MSEPVVRIEQAASEPVIFAVAGDVHAHHRLMVDLIGTWERDASQTVAFVLQVGDFEPTRCDDDLKTMPVPSKYRIMGDFQLFASGKERFPWPIIFVGGNHEPFGYLDNYPYGGVIHAANGSPILNCYYIGLAGWAELWGIRVLGVTGIYANEDIYNSMRPPITMIGTAKLKRFAYMRQAEIDRATLIASEIKPDVMLFHDWPESDLGVRLGQDTKFDGKHGNPEALALVELFAPAAVFCGHMHIPMSWDITHGDGRITHVSALGYLPLALEGCVQIFQWDAVAHIINRIACWDGMNWLSPNKKVVNDGI